MGIIDCIYFRFQGCIRSLELRTLVEEMTLSKLEAKLYQKLALDGSKVTLKMSYCPADLGLVGECLIEDDGDARVYLRNASRKQELLVEAMSKSSVGMNYDDDAKEKAVDRTEAAVKIEQGVARTEAVDEDVKTEQGVARTEAADEDVKIGDVERTEAVDENVKVEDFDYDYNFPAPTKVECIQYVESWEDGLDVSLKQEFPNKQTLQDAIDKGAFMRSFGIAIKKSDRKRYTVNCCKEGCGWTVRGRSIGSTETFRIVKHQKFHTCSRASQSQSEKMRRGTPSLVAAVLRERRSKAVKTIDSAKDVMDLVKTQLGVRVSYSTAWRGRHLAVCEKYGTPEESYTSLYSYLYMLEKSNHGTTTQLELSEDGKFKFLFISLGACREGFRWMRKVIVLDATHLKHSYGGVLVFAAAQDGNRHTYPLAIGILNSENDPSWKWFMEMLQRVIPDSSELVFITDRNASIFNGIETVYPKAYHGFCVNHLSQNVKVHSPSHENKDVLASRFIECSRQYTLPDFERAYTAFKERYPLAGNYLDGYWKGEKWKKGTCEHERWVRAKFPRDRYNIDTSNYVESLNSVFKEARQYFLIPMIDYIIATMSRWFDAHRVEATSGRMDEKLVPFLENYMHASWATAKKLLVVVLNTYQLEYSVTGDDGKPYLVKLLNKSCSCGFYEIEKYPCVHAIAAYIEYQRHYHSQPPKDRPREIKYEELCSHYFWTATWTLAYERTIYAVPDRSQWDVPDDVRSKIILPPDRIVRSGRKQLKRRPGNGEARPRKRTQNVRPKRTPVSYPWFLAPRAGEEDSSQAGG